MFRSRQHFVSSSCGVADTLVLKPVKEGSSSYYVDTIDATKKILPKRELYDLSTLIKAGIDLKKVSSLLLEDTALSASVSSDDSKPVDSGSKSDSV